MKTLFINFTVCCFLLGTPLIVFGQIVCTEFPCTLSSSDSGEITSAALDNLFTQAADSGERIFVIARLGTGEKDEGLNLKRLCDARNYFPDRLSDGPYKHYLDLFPIVFGEGSAVKGEGRLEFYLGSKLQLTRNIKLNGDANLSCCGELSPRERKQRHDDCKYWKKRGAKNIGILGIRGQGSTTAILNRASLNRSVKLIRRSAQPPYLPQSDSG